MPSIHYLSDDKEVEVSNNSTILETSLRVGIQHAHACGGYARCSTCRVLILDGLENCLPRNTAEQRLAKRLHFSPEIRLACQTQLTDDVKLRRLVLDAEDIELTSQIKPGATADSVGLEREVAILFSDIRGFTTFSEHNLPYDVVHVLNRYFHDMGQVIHQNGGYIDNYMGDGIMALFGVHDPHEATLRAVKSGVEMLKALDQLNPYIETVYKTRFEIGVGIHYGEVVVGTIGAANRKRETAIGDAVNVASRIESANKEVGTNLLVSEDAYQQVKELTQIGKTASITLKGKSGEYMLYEITGMDTNFELEPVESAAAVDTSSESEKPSPRNILKELLIAIGAALLGAFLVGFITQLTSGNVFVILTFIIMGFIGAPLLIWGLLR